MKFGMIVPQVIRIDWRSRISDTKSYFQDGGRDIILHRKVLPPGGYTLSVFPVPVQHGPPVSGPWYIRFDIFIKLWFRVAINIIALILLLLRFI